MLSSADVAKLLQDPNTDNRAEAAAKVAETFSSSELSDDERKIVEDIFGAMLKDAAVRVRKALADSLKDNPDVPHDVAKALADDVDDVALPMIESSMVLTESDLISIVKSKGGDAQKAVAGRSDVSSAVADVIVSEADEDAVATLVANDSAELGEETYANVLDKFGESDKVKGSMASRGELPVTVAERLVTMVSEQLREHIMTHHEVSEGTASDLLLESREKATVSLVDGGSTQSVIDLVDQLKKNGRLTPSLVLRALCMGDMTFFEAALGCMVNIPVSNVYKLVHDQGGNGLKRLLEAAKMPAQFVPVIEAAIKLTEESVQTGGDDREMFRQLMIERVLTAMEDDVDSENLDYLIGKLQKVG